MKMAKNQTSYKYIYLKLSGKEESTQKEHVQTKTGQSRSDCMHARIHIYNTPYAHTHTHNRLPKSLNNLVHKYTREKKRKIFIRQTE